MTKGPNFLLFSDPILAMYTHNLEKSRVTYIPHHRGQTSLEEPLCQLIHSHRFLPYLVGLYPNCIITLDHLFPTLEHF